MAKGNGPSAGSKGSGQSAGGKGSGQSAGGKGAGYPSTTGKPSGGGRDNGPRK
jgi:hypothetical protein